ncbi:hypothetical protein ABQE62_05940 [Mycolicibacterium fortuitum]
MSTAAMRRVVQDRALSDGLGAAGVAMYGAVVASFAELLGELDADTSGFPDDPVLQAAMHVVDEETVAYMGSWVCAEWAAVCAAGDTLDQLDQLADLLPAVPIGAAAYRAATVELVLGAGDSLPAAVWAGAEGQKRWLRLYGRYTADDAELCAADPVVNAAFRELTSDQRRNIAAWVRDHWEQIDNLATARAA